MKNQAFSAFYYSVSRFNREHLRVRNKIVEACEVSSSVFYNWTKGVTSVPKHHQKTIAEVTGKEISELFPEKE